MKPILVTGGNRSGTTWVGRMLCFSSRLFLVWEPFNLEKAIEGIGHPLQSHYRMLRRSESGRLHRFILLKTLIELTATVDGGRTPGKKLMKLGEVTGKTVSCLTGRMAPLYKDPIALMSAEWYERKLGTRNVVLIRHPGAYVNSVKRLDWKTNVDEFAEQPWLMETLPGELQDEIHRRISSRETPRGYVLEEAALCWKVFYQVVDRYRKEHPDWIFVRHEDLSMNYLEEFRNLYERLGLGWTGRISERIENACSSRNDVVQGDVAHSERQDSAALVKLWQKSLSPEDQRVIREITEPVARLYYDDQSWE